MSASITIVVEGKKDKRVLERVVPPGCNIVLCQGKHGMRSYLDGLATQSQAAVQTAFYVGFRDRDFDFELPASPGLQTTKGVPAQQLHSMDVFVSYRRTIENYLLQPSVYRDFYTNLPTKTRARQLTPVDYEFLLKLAAVKIHHYQAARAALGEIRKPNPLDASFLRDAPTGRDEFLKSGQLPLQLDRDACIEAARAVLARYRQQAATIADFSGFEATFSRFEALFDAQFYAADQYLAWFQGKDLIAAFHHVVATNFGPFPMATFEDYAIANFDHTQFPDLVEFRLILQQRLSQN
jgi:hypothetical protein